MTAHAQEKAQKRPKKTLKFILQADRSLSWQVGGPKPISFGARAVEEGFLEKRLLSVGKGHSRHRERLGQRHKGTEV